jgi:hypothetical protein
MILLFHHAQITAQNVAVWSWLESCEDKDTSRALPWTLSEEVLWNHIQWSNGDNFLFWWTEGKPAEGIFCVNWNDDAERSWTAPDPVSLQDERVNEKWKLEAFSGCGADRNELATRALCCLRRSMTLMMDRTIGTNGTTHSRNVERVRDLKIISLTGNEPALTDTTLGRVQAFRIRPWPRSARSFSAQVTARYVFRTFFSNRRFDAVRERQRLTRAEQLFFVTMVIDSAHVDLTT